MDTVKYGKFTVRVCDSKNKIPDIGGVPEAAAIAFYSDGSECAAAIENALYLKYRIVDKQREDVRLAVVCGGVDYVGSGKAAYAVTSSDVLGEVLRRRNDESPELIIFPDLLCSCDDALASAYGSLAAKLVTLTDYRVRCVTGDKAYDAKAVGEVRKTVLRGFNEELTGKRLIDLHLRALATMATEPDLLCVDGGQSQMARAVELLLRHEQRPSLPAGVVELVCAVVINGAYKSYLSSDLGFVAPPDNNTRIEQASEYLGLDESSLAKTLAPIIGEKSLERIRYALGVNKGELLAEICYNEIVLRKALSLVRRRFVGVGYATANALDKSDLGLALALAPDLSGSALDTLVGIMKCEGVLDNFM